MRRLWKRLYECLREFAWTVEFLVFIQEHAHRLVCWGGAVTGGLTAGFVAAGGQVLLSLVAIAVGAVAGIVIVYQIERWRTPSNQPIAKLTGSLEALGHLLESELTNPRPSY